MRPFSCLRQDDSSTAGQFSKDEGRVFAVRRLFVGKFSWESRLSDPMIPKNRPLRVCVRPNIWVVIVGMTATAAAVDSAVADGST